MTKYVHIVYVHPVELGEPNLAKVNEEKEFDTWKQAMGYVEHLMLTQKAGSRLCTTAGSMMLQEN